MTNDAALPFLPDALIFDFDGTILDTETPEYYSWQEVYEAHGVELPLAIWTESIGRGHDTATFDPYGYLESLIGRRVDANTIRPGRRARFYELMALEKPRPGIGEWLESARILGIPLAVASSSDRDWVAGHLKRLGLRDYFDVLRCADDVTRTKPDPELYHAACTALNACPERSIAVEDSPNGLRAAKQAGMFAIAYPNPMTADLSLEIADLLIENGEFMTLNEIFTLAAGRQV
jgi:HAD superfamily hydrolase (TIGR01509 family)